MSPPKLCRPAGYSSGEEEYDEFGDLKPMPIKTRNLAPVEIDYQDELLKEACAGNVQGVTAALENGAEVDTAYSGCYTALMTACHRGYPEVVKKLLELGANPNYRDNNLISPLMTICFSHCNDEDKLIECLNLLIAYKVNVNAIDEHGMTPLMFACKYGREDLAIQLMENHANINITDSQHWSALFWAINNGSARLVNILVSAGARKKFKDFQGRTPFDIAASKPRLKEIAYLLCPRKLRQEFLNRGRHSFVKLEDTDSAYYDQIISKMEELSTNSVLPRTFVTGQKVSFYTFLTLTDTQLQDLGVKLSWHRRLALEYIRDYHFLPWVRSSIAEIPSNHKLTYRQGTNMMLELTAKVSILNSSLIYAQRELRTNVIGSKANDCLKTLVKRNALLMRRLLYALEDLVETIDRLDTTLVIPSDYIMPSKKEQLFPWQTSCVSIICLSAACAALFVVKCKFT